jgi:hypothetical protein
MQNKSYLNHLEEDLKLYIQDMLDRSKDVEACSKNNYADLHQRILELETSVRRIVIASYQIKAVHSTSDGSLGLNFEDK